MADAQRIRRVARPEGARSLGDSEYQSFDPVFLLDCGCLRLEVHFKSSPRNDALLAETPLPLSLSFFPSLVASNKEEASLLIISSLSLSLSFFFLRFGTRLRYAFSDCGAGFLDYTWDYRTRKAPWLKNPGDIPVPGSLN